MSRNRTTKGALITTVIRTDSERYDFDNDRAEMKRQYPNATIRTFHRDAKADGLTFPLHILTVRERLPKS